MSFEDMKVDDLRALASENGVDLPDRAKKADIVEALQAAGVPAPGGIAQIDPVGGAQAPGDGDTAAGTIAPDPASMTRSSAAPIAETETELDDGRIELRRPIENFTPRGDWTDPFSGLIVMHSNAVCVQSGAVREGDEAVVRVSQEQAEELS